MGNSLKKRAKRHGLWPESGTFRRKDLRPSIIRKERAQARRESRKRVGKPKKAPPWKRRYTRRVVIGEGGDEKIFWDRGPK